MKRWLFAAPAFVFVMSVIGLGAASGFRPAAAQGVRPLFQILAIVSCASTGPCQTFSNSSSGAGVSGKSTNGNGGTFVSTNSIGISGRSLGKAPGVKGEIVIAPNPGIAGVEGVDLSTGRTNTGVLGTSANGTGVTGTSSSGIAVVGTSTSSGGVFGSTAFASKGQTFGQSGVEGLDLSTDGGVEDIGVDGSSTNGIGVEAKSSQFVGANVVGGRVISSTEDFPALSIFGITNDSDLIDGCSPAVQPTADPCDEAHAVFRVDSVGDLNTFGGGIFTSNCVVVGPENCSVGNVNIEGQYQVDGTCVTCAAATAAHPGRAVTRYVETQTLPTVEDFGEARLVDGQAYVSLDVEFANVIDAHSNYLVFITAEGPNHGLYVAQKTIRGFAVRENPGGQSTISFSYRIVARPYGENSPRLPTVTTPALRTPRREGAALLF